MTGREGEHEMKLEEILKEEDKCVYVFLCRCNPEGIADADLVMQETYRRLGELGHEVRPGNLLTTVVFSLNHDFGAEITGIYIDMWSVVVADTWRGEEEDKIHVSIQCDEVEDGVAAVWLAYALHSRVREPGGFDPAETSPDRG